jgi:phosphoserine phosphatase
MFKLLILDMEPLIFNAEYLPLLAKEVGLEEKVAKITSDGLSGKIAWKIGLIERIKLPKGIPLDVVKRVADEIDYTEGIQDVFRFAKEKGIITAVITGGFRIQARRIEDEQGVDYILANDLIFKDNKLHDVKVHVHANKNNHVNFLKALLGIDSQDIITVGEGMNDLTMLKNNFGVGYNPTNERVRKACKVIIEKPIELIHILEAS